MIRHALIAAGIAALAAYPAAAQDSSTSVDQQQTAAVTAGTPQEFATKAMVSNMFEIQSSMLALDKSQKDAVRQFAQRMIDDHTKAGEKMKQAAEAEGVTDLPKELDSEHMDKMAKLQDASGDAFDQQYVDMQVNGHQAAVSLFDSFKDEEGELADFAGNTLPTLEEHLSMIKDIDQQMGQ